MAEMLGKIPPQSPEAEMAVLGAMLIEKEAVVKAIEILDSGDFYKSSHRAIYNAITELFSNNEPVDEITVVEKLKKEKVLQDIGGASYITSLTNFVSTAANIENYAKIVKEKSVLRAIIVAGTNMVEMGYRDDSIPDEILDQSETKLFEINNSRTQKGFSDLPKALRATLEYMEKIHKDKRDVPGLASGFTELDDLTTGFNPGELIIIAGRPGMGKTAFALNIVEHVAIKEKKAVAVFSLEMSVSALLTRLVCSLARVDLQKVRRGQIANHWADITTVVSKISEAPIYIDDSSSINALDIRAKSRRLALELKSQGKKLSMIVVDYLQFMTTARRVESREKEVAEMSRALKSLAKDLEVPVVVLSQLSRKPEEGGREGKPKLSDLRESGAIEQDADVVMFVYRDGYYDKNDPDKDKTASIIVAKQRNGPTGDIKLVFNGEYTRFDNFSARES